MQQIFSQLLAATGEESETVKFVIGAIAVAIWLFGGIAKQLSGRKENERSDDQWNPPIVPPDNAFNPQAGPPAFEPVMVLQTPQQPGSRKGSARKSKQQQKKTKFAEKPAYVMTPADPVPIAAKRGGANAGSLKTYLSPITLRRQFILTEILNKPVSMRPPREI